MALAEASKEAMYLQSILKALNGYLNINIPLNIPVIYKDNSTTLKLSNNPEFHKRSKHIDIRYHYTRDLISNKQLNIIYIPTTEQLADPLTKGLTAPVIKKWLEKISLEEFNK